MSGVSSVSFSEMSRNPRIERVDTVIKVVVIVALAAIALCAVLIGVTAAQYLPAIAPLYGMIPIPLSIVALAVVSCCRERVAKQEKIILKDYDAAKVQRGKKHNNPPSEDSSASSSS